jgi:general secretion pathway protein G
MKNRKRGFSLVELLIVLAVIAALIATITPVALNAIKKSKATQVAQNLKTLASAFENAAYVDNEIKTDKNLKDYGRDVSDSYYIAYTATSGGKYTVWVVTTEKTDINIVNDILKGAFEVSPSDQTLSNYRKITTSSNADPASVSVAKNSIAYTFTFNLY